MPDPLTLIHGDALGSLRTLEGESVQTCVTSPPYWGLRDYGTEPLVWDNHNGCDHKWESYLQPSANGQTTHAMIAETLNESSATRKPRLSDFCKCGAWRGAFGLEPTPDLYVQHIVEIFREVKRVLRNDGTCWINLGDSYAGSWGAQSRPNGNDIKSTLQGGSLLSARQIEAHPRGTHTGSVKNTPGLKPKDLVGVPWRVAFALQADGWYLRSEITWCKRASMPESVVDRPTSATEKIFLFTKSQRYLYNQDAVRTPTAESTIERYKSGWNGNEYRDHPSGHHNNFSRFMGSEAAMENAAKGANLRNYWLLNPEPFSLAHFATFPTEIPRRCILLGSNVGDVVLDTFSGSGTTAKVAIELGRKAIAIEPKLEYVEMIKRRCQTTIGLPLIA